MRGWHERTAYIVAALFALHPVNADSGNMGDHLRELKNRRNRELPGSEDPALERRFAALLAAHDEELDSHLRWVVTMLKQQDIPVNWLQLFMDISAWGHPDPDWQARVRRSWANSFYRADTTKSTEEASADSTNDE
jgi:CRISPR type I-E-associated protein CasB/Cse2